MVSTTENTAKRRLLRISDRARVASESRLLKVQGCSTRLPLEDEPRTKPRDAGERRRSTRVAATARVPVRRIGGCNFQLAMEDISSHGCRVEMVERWQRDDNVITRLPALQALGSRICWTEGRSAGLEFLTNIHPAVFEMLLGCLSDDASR